jgi:Family of unknown function (DUF6152)
MELTNMELWRRSIFLATAFVGIAIPVGAHHSLQAYDTKKTIILKGSVTAVDWRNPHAFFYIDVIDESGRVTKWEFESGSPNGLYRRGLRKDTVKAGDVITIQGFPARDGSRFAIMRRMTLADGRVFDPEPDAPPQFQQPDTSRESR